MNLRLNTLIGCILVLVFAGTCLVVSTGCGSSSTPESVMAEMNNQNIKRLANMYLMYQEEHNWQGPEDEESLKTFIREYRPKILNRMGIDPAKTDDLFVNERDGEPFKIRYGVPGSMMGCPEPAVFEAVGKNGKKMVAFLNMVQREVDEAEYNDLLEGKVTSSSSTEREN